MVAVRLFRTMHMCHCSKEVTRLMHATFRRDRKRLFKKFIITPPQHVTDEDAGFVEKREEFLSQMLDHFMITKYHE